MRRSVRRHPAPTQHPSAEVGEGQEADPVATGSPALLDLDCLPLNLVLDVLSVRWSVLALRGLAAGHVRFNQLLRHLGGISHKVLIATLRSLQRDGFVAGPLTDPTPDSDGRTPGYRLTPIGWELLRLVAHIGQWAQENAPEVRRARGEFDRRQAAACAHQHRRAVADGMLRPAPEGTPQG
ncbi:MAG TPA: helix-turn-helix domain-containing protein [Micromonosporaceae bacterium]|nr:helix-turn-helix domain-containing protein [Micromonosporaceae bacterium]